MLATRTLVGPVHSRATLLSWKEVRMDTFQALALHMGIDLRRRDLRVPQHDLEGSKICPALQEMGRERVADHMRGQLCCNAGFFRPPAEQLPEPLSRQRRPPPCHKHVRRRSAPEQ